VLAGLLLLLGALVLIFLPAVKHDGSGGKAETADTTMPPGADAGKPLPVAIAGPGPGLTDMSKPAVPAEQVSAPPAAAGAGAAPITVPSSIATLPPAVLGPTPPAAVVASTPPIAPPVAAPAPVAAASQAMPAGIVTFRAKGESWVEVTDAKGTVVLRRTLTAGEVAGASGALPLAAVVGKADLTQVQVRGQAFDLNAVARDNVARFEVK
jgi:cytoskeleton protein RodZ